MLITRSSLRRARVCMLLLTSRESKDGRQRDYPAARTWAARRAAGPAAPPAGRPSGKEKRAHT